jgi:hypothetical protein
MWLGARDPDCCNWDVEGAKRIHGPELIGFMKRKSEYYPPFKDEGEVVAGWGEAQLIRYLDGKTELRGGSDQDRAEAREWMSMFWHEAVLSDGSGRRG